jgi:hypothetical protein
VGHPNFGVATVASKDESDLDRVARLIAELDSEESLLTGLDPAPNASPEIELSLAGLWERRAQLEEELAEVWAKRCSRC